MNYSEKFAEKLMRAYFNDISKSAWVVILLKWLVDSKYRKMEYLNKFLEKQLINPDSRLVELAKTLRHENVYETIYAAEQYAINNFKYTSEEGEYYQTAIETLTRKRGDCDDLNSFIYIICRLAGVPEFILFSVIGDTVVGYHYYNIAFDFTRDILVPVDATLYPTDEKLTKREKYDISSLKYKLPDYVFNEKYTLKWK